MKDIIETRLQEEASLFITQNKLAVNEIEVFPKEIETYYFKKGKFEDESVHKNELQKNNKNHFYVHRWGTNKGDKYKGGYYPGLDFVVSEDDDTYYSYLIRSAVIKYKGAFINKGQTIIGPNKVLNTICEIGKVTFENLEKDTVKLENSCIPNDGVVISERINLNKGFIDKKLRFVLCDDLYISSKYPKKEEMIINFLTSENKQIMPANPIDFCKNKLGYVPSSIKKYYANQI